jgi:hypothetical protein
MVLSKILLIENTRAFRTLPLAGMNKQLRLNREKFTKKMSSPCRWFVSEVS